MEALAFIAVLIFPTGLILVGCAEWFEVHIPDKLGAGMIITGMIFIWGPIAFGGLLFIGYELIIRTALHFIGIETPSIFFTP